MDTNDDKRQLLLDMMTSRDLANPLDIDAHLLQPWLRLAHHLSPLIGESGFCALYGRAARLVVPEFEWLSANQSCKSTQALFAGLRDNFASVDAADAGTANAALLKTFTRLLCALIGEALTIRLLDMALNGEHEQKNAQEYK